MHTDIESITSEGINFGDINDKIGY